LSCQLDEGTGVAQTEQIEWEINGYSKNRHFYLDITQHQADQYVFVCK